MNTSPPDDSGADDLVARAQQAAQLQSRAQLIKRLTDGGICARMFGVACEANDQHSAFTEMVNSWGQAMLDAAKALKNDA